MCVHKNFFPPTFSEFLGMSFIAIFTGFASLAGYENIKYRYWRWGRCSTFNDYVFQLLVERSIARGVFANFWGSSREFLKSCQIA